jgi:hypothetical protein
MWHTDTLYAECNVLFKLEQVVVTASEWSEFLATDPGVPGSIPGHYKKKFGSGTGSTQPR